MSPVDVVKMFITALQAGEMEMDSISITLLTKILRLR